MKNNIEISQILSGYETDKVCGTRYGGDGHCYGEAYDKLFSLFDRSAPLDILEVGTQKGGSLLAWKKYFPNSNVTGVDIVDVVLPEYRSDAINYVISDIKQYDDSKFYDIIIDDGSHYLLDTIYVVKKYTHQLKEGGVLIVEDVQNKDEWESALRQLKAKDVTMEVIDMRRVHGNYDDVLIVFKKNK